MQAQQNDVISPEQAATLHGLFVERARRTPDKVAYRHFQQNDRTTFDGTTSHSTKLLENISQVAGYQGERVLVNQLLSKPPQAIAERAARFDAAVVFIQRVLVFFQPLIALRLPDGLDQSLLRFGVEDNTAHCFSLTFVIRIIYAHRVLTSKPANRCAAWQSIVCGENELQQILHFPPAENRGFATWLIFLPAVNQRGGWGI